MAEVARVQHIIRNDNVDITECDRLMPHLPAGGMWGFGQVVILDATNVATWDATPPPRNASICLDCWKAYSA